MIGISIILALLCGLIRFIFLITREIKAGSQAAGRYVQSMRTIKKSAEDFVEQAISAADLPKDLKSYDILLSAAQTLKRNRDMPIKAALIRENPVFIPLPKSVSPSYIMAFLLLRKTKKHLFAKHLGNNRTVNGNTFFIRRKNRKAIAFRTFYERKRNFRKKEPFP